MINGSLSENIPKRSKGPLIAVITNYIIFQCKELNPRVCSYEANVLLLSYNPSTDFKQNIMAGYIDKVK